MQPSTTAISLGLSQHTLGGNYACSIISGLWMHSLLFCKDPEEYNLDKLAAMLANWIKIGVSDYKVLQEYQLRFQSASRTVKDIKLLKDSVKCVYEQNGIITTSDALVRQLNLRYDLAEDEQPLYVSLPAALDKMHKFAKAHPLRRCVGTFTSGTGYTSCICIFASGTAYFVDSHWNDTKTGERLSGAEPHLLRTRNAAGVLIRFCNISTLQQYLLKTYDQPPLSATPPESSLEPRWAFALFIGDRISGWEVNKKKRSSDGLSFKDDNYQTWRSQQLRMSGTEIHVAEKRIVNY